VSVLRGAARRYAEAHPFAVAIVVGLLARLVLLLVYHHGETFQNRILPPTDDQYEYMELAENLLGGKGYVIYHNGFGAPGPYGYRPPVYPIYLALVSLLTGTHYGLMRVSQTLATIAFVPLMMLGLRRLGVGFWAVLAGGLFAAVNPFLVYHSLEFLSDWLFNLFFFAGLVAYLQMMRAPERRRPALLAGLLLALAALTRGEGWFYAWILLGVSALVGGRRTWRPCALALCAFLPLIAVWTARNWVQFHAFIPTQRGAMALSIIDSHQLKYSGYPWPGYKEWRADVNRRELQVPSEQREAFVMGEIKTFYRAHPADFIKSCLHKAAHFYAPVLRTQNPETSEPTPYQGKFYVISSLAGYAVFLPFFFIGVAALYRRDRAITLAFLAVMGANGVVGMLANPNIRIRTEMQCLMLLFATVGLEALVRRTSRAPRPAVVSPVPGDAQPIG
jgi:4-amino-4-deoxy-L-arabinose transferase-like glycosyltransferase